MVSGVGVGEGFDGASSEPPPPQAVKLVAITKMVAFSAEDNLVATLNFGDKNERFRVLIGISIQHPCMVYIKDHPCVVYIKDDSLAF
jgi:hypothetical protein